MFCGIFGSFHLVGVFGPVARSLQCTRATWQHGGFPMVAGTCPACPRSGHEALLKNENRCGRMSMGCLPHIPDSWMLPIFIIRKSHPVSEQFLPLSTSHCLSLSTPKINTITNTACLGSHRSMRVPALQQFSACDKSCFRAPGEPTR